MERKQSNKDFTSSKYEPISPTPDLYHVEWLFSGPGTREKSTSTWLTLKMVKTHADAIYTRPTSKEDKRRENKETSKSYPVLHIITSEPILHQTSIPIAPIPRHGSRSEWSRWQHQLMIRHGWEVPLPASVIAVNRIRQLHRILFVDI